MEGTAALRPTTALATELADAREVARTALQALAVSGANVLLTPFFVSFYEIVPTGPFLLEAAALVGLVAFACLHPTFRHLV